MWYPIWCEFADREISLLAHWHFGTEFIFVTEGSAHVTVADKKYTVSAGQVLMIHRVVHHSTDSISTPYGRFCLIVQPDEIHKSPIGSNMLIHLTNIGTDSACVIDTGEDRDDICRLFAALEKNWNRDDKYNAEYLLSAVELLLVTLCRHCDRENNIPADERMFRVREDIDRDFATELTVPELAKRHFISEDHLIHEFKRVTGFSPGQYIIINRLAYAQELLSTTRDPLPIIAQKTGFGDVNNFIRSFKKQFGVPPGQYRRSQQNK